MTADDMVQLLDWALGLWPLPLAFSEQDPNTIQRSLAAQAYAMTSLHPRLRAQNPLHGTCDRLQKFGPALDNLFPTRHSYFYNNAIRLHSRPSQDISKKMQKIHPGHVPKISLPLEGIL